MLLCLSNSCTAVETACNGQKYIFGQEAGVILKIACFLKDMRVSSCLSPYLTIQDCNINFKVIAISIFKEIIAYETKTEGKEVEE